MNRHHHRKVRGRAPTAHHRRVARLPVTIRNDFADPLVQAGGTTARNDVIASRNGGRPEPLAAVRRLSGREVQL